jgi:competence protein ComEC
MLVDSAGLAPAATLDPAQATGFDVGERVVARALRAFGVRALDTLVITHGDPDHLGGAPAIVRAFAPRAVWEGIPVPPHAPMRALRDVASAIGAEWRSVRDGERLSVAGVDIGVLHPAPADWERQRVRNDDSVVLDVRYGRVSVILPGDIGSEGEVAVMARLQPAALTVLKAPHHGSATSSSARFLEAASPRVAIFSAGRANRFGHPAPAVVARYRAMGAALFSTADDGAVIVDTDGRSVMVVGWRSGRTLFVRAE